MKYNPDIHHRQSIRLQHYDYSQVGANFVTVCTQNRECLFGNIVDDKMNFNDAGRMILTVWNDLPARFDYTVLDEFVLMPNHFHGIIFFTDIRSDTSEQHQPNVFKNHPGGTLPHTLGRVIQAFKSITTHGYIDGIKQHGWPPFTGKLWQRNYWEHIVRNEQELHRIREYIHLNPLQWGLDRLNPRGER